MRANGTSARRLDPAPAPERLPALVSMTPVRLSPAPVLPGHPAGPAGPALVHGVPTWRAALDLLWSALAGDGTEGVELTRAAPGGSSGPARPERDADEQARIAALVELAQRGDNEAFAQLYDVYVDTVFRYVLVRVANRSLAEDLTSETFLRAMRRIDSFTWQGKDIAAWFVTIARNLIADHVKSAKFRFEVATADMRDADQRVDAPDTEVLTRLRDERLVSAIRDLGSDQAECITLRFLQGLSLADTAKVLGKSEGAVKQLQLRATRALRKSLEGVEL